jgi:hypothetical protein
MMTRGRYEQVALLIMLVAEIPNFWSGFLPSLFTIATFSGSQGQAEHTKRWIRRGEMQAGGLSIGLGIGTSLLIGELLPLVATLAMIGYLAFQYETALRKGLSTGPGLDMTQPAPQQG